jgi:putative spermidine/putrescine transport system permease protein
MAQVARPAVSPTPAGPLWVSQLSWAWVGIVPFFVFAVMFLILPTGLLMVGGLQDPRGQFTLANLRDLFQPTILSSYLISIKVSAASAVGGALVGFALAYAAITGGLPGWLRPALLTFSGVASNFAGVPLAFAFLATLGRTGLATALLMRIFGFDIYRAGFNLLSFWGLTITYMYFQIPLMVLIMAPAIDGLRREWREASANLGASTLEYWRYVALPILWPPMLGATLLLFANAFGAVATAYALTGSFLNIVTIVLFAQIRGDVLHNQNLGYALALGMVIVTGLSNAAYIWLRGRSERWLR